jgi:hypothetical protein
MRGDWRETPGGDLVREGLRDLREGRETAPALLVAIGAPRLQQLGIEVPALETPEHRLYDLLEREDSDSAHSRVQDMKDAEMMFSHGLVLPDELLRLFERIEPELYRYPAIDADTLRRRIESAVRLHTSGR